MDQLNKKKWYSINTYQTTGNEFLLQNSAQNIGFQCTTCVSKKKKKELKLSNFNSKLDGVQRV